MEAAVDRVQFSYGHVDFSVAQIARSGTCSVDAPVALLADALRTDVLVAVENLSSAG